ncbi:FUSC family protein [Leucobacter sp.]
MLRAAPLRSAAKRWGRQLSRLSRLVLAAKTAVAAALAWYLAPFVPFAESEYSYYAPLGVLVSMYTTVLDSVRAGVQALVGLAVGIALGLGALSLVVAGAPSIAAVALVVAVGVALGGLHVLGAGRDWIPIAGLLVLLLSGREGGEFSLSYLVTMGFGVVVGIIVQWVAMPPLYFGEARGRLADLRGVLSACLDEAEELVRGRQHDESRLRGAVDALVVTLGEVTEEIREARRSERANPRARRRHGERETIDEQLRALDRAAFFVRALSELVVAVESPGPLCEALGDAIGRCRAVVAGVAGRDARQRALDEARGALERYFRALEEDARRSPASLADAVASGACLRCIVDALA